MNLSHIAVLLVALLIGVTFAGTLRGLPGVSMLPSY
jgi:hypothetical protein